MTKQKTGKIDLKPELKHKQLDNIAYGKKGSVEMY